MFQDEQEENDNKIFTRRTYVTINNINTIQEMNTEQVNIDLETREERCYSSETKSYIQP